LERVHGITVSQLKREHPSRPWNPLVAQVFSMRGIIERWGRGTNRIVEQTLEAGFAEPEMIDSRLAITVRFTSSRALTPERKPHVLPDIREPG
jgi:ATP-dependent DNA helicase RecG